MSDAFASRPFAPDLFAGRRYAVLGLGRNGAPAARALVAMGAAVEAWDDGSGARADAADLPLHRREHADGLDAVILSPGIPHRGDGAPVLVRDAIARRVPVLSDAQLLQDAVRRSGSRARFVGITGTNGKSTTTVLVRHLLEQAGVPAVAGGNLGPAALALPLLPDDGVYVLEMSSFMLERVPAFRFDAAVLLNLSPDHLDRHGDMNGYVAAKRLIFANRHPHDLAVLGIDDPDTATIADAVAGAIRVSGRDTADARVRVTADGVLIDDRTAIADLAGIRSLRGTHNRQNAAAAVAVALGLGVPVAAIAPALASFPGLAHRQHPVATVDGVTFVDDSKATNADAAARALLACGRSVWIAGGQAKAGGIEALRPILPDTVADALLIGRDAPVLARTLADAGVPHRVVDTLERAVPAAFASARAGAVDTVLLSPACASFDQFRDFAERGARFAALASTLPRTGALVA